MIARGMCHLRGTRFFCTQSLRTRDSALAACLTSAEADGPRLHPSEGTLLISHQGSLAERDQGTTPFASITFLPRQQGRANRKGRSARRLPRQGVEQGL